MNSSESEFAKQVKLKVSAKMTFLISTNASSLSICSMYEYKLGVFNQLIVLVLSQKIVYCQTVDHNQSKFASFVKFVHDTTLRRCRLLYWVKQFASYKNQETSTHLNINLNRY